MRQGLGRHEENPACPVSIIANSGREDKKIVNFCRILSNVVEFGMYSHPMKVQILGSAAKNARRNQSEFRRAVCDGVAGSSRYLNRQMSSWRAKAPLPPERRCIWTMKCTAVPCVYGLELEKSAVHLCGNMVAPVARQDF